MQTLDATLRISKLERLCSTFLEKNAYHFLSLPSVDSSENMVMDSRSVSMCDLYTIVKTDGQTLSLPNDLVPFLLRQIVRDNIRFQRYYSFGDVYSPSQTEKGRQTEIVAVAVGLSGFEIEAEMATLAIDFVRELGMNVTLKLGNTEITQGILDAVCQKEESRNRVQRILEGKVNDDVDMRVNQTFGKMKDCIYDEIGLTIKTMAETIDNKRSIDGLLDVFEINNVLEIQGNTGSTLDPFFLGSESYENGFVFCVKDKKIPIRGGRVNFSVGEKTFSAVYLRIDATKLLSFVFPDGRANVVLLVTDSMIAHESAAILKRQFQASGYSVECIYQCIKEKRARYLSLKNPHTSLVHIDETGGVTSL